MNIHELAQKFRRALLRREARAQAKMLAAYNVVWQGLEREIAAIVTRIQSEGQTPAHALFAEQRLRKLQDQLANAILELAAQAAAEALAEQAVVVELAQQHAGALFQMAVSKAQGASATFAKLPKDALAHLVGVAADGSPLSEIFGELAESLTLSTRDTVRDALLQGVALGWHPTKTAAWVRRQVDNKGDNPARDPALVRRLNTLIRTETLRAHREATRLSYEKNKKYVRQWQWSSSRDPRTCLICWAMDGKVFPVDEPFVSHISCRCTQLPILAGAETDNDTGPAAFAKLEKGYQKQILGPGGYALYQDGVPLESFVGVKTHERWGDSRYRRSLAAIRATRAKGDGYFANAVTAPYQPAGVVIAQIRPEACAAACCRMVLRDAGQDVPESYLRGALQTDDDGTDPRRIPAVLKDFGLADDYHYRRDLALEALAEVVQHKPALAFVASQDTARGHLVVIDGVEAEWVLIRDPQDGRAYRLALEDFKTAWLHNGQGRAVILK